MKRILLCVLVISCSFYSNSFSQTSDDSWKKLSLREKIGLTMVLFPSDMPTYLKQSGTTTTAEFLKKYPVGSFFLGGEVIKDASDEVSTVTKLVNELNAASKIPLLFCGDMESGVGINVKGLTILPHLMALGAANNSELAYNYGKATALEARTIGVNWLFTPVSDLNQNHQNPLVNIRAVSENADIALNNLKPLIRGLQENGIAATSKHFPGDGVDYRDQHLKTTVNSLSMEEWRRQHGRVFKELIESGVQTIMTGHISLPAYQSEKEKINGQYLPATLSYELTTNLLKKELGFKGVIVSDYLAMGGFKQWYDNQQEAELKCFEAGTDFFCVPSIQLMDELEKAILSGRIPMSRLEDAVQRVWALREKAGLNSKKPQTYRAITAEEQKFVANTAKQAGDMSVTLVQDKNKFLPLKAKDIKKVLIVGITPHEVDYESMNTMKKEFEQRGIAATLQLHIWFTQLEAIEKDYDLIIYAASRCPHRPMGPLNFWKNEAASVWSSLSYAKNKSVVVSLGTPYLYEDYYSSANVYINAYSFAPESQKAAVRAILGEIPFVGVSPVTLRK